MASTEKSTQAALIQWLEYKKIFHWRNNTGAFKTERGGFIKFGAVGSPDIVCIINGQYVGVECKDVKGVLSPNQKIFKEKLEKAGGIYLVARSVTDTIKEIEEICELF